MASKTPEARPPAVDTLAVDTLAVDTLAVDTLAVDTVAVDRETISHAIESSGYPGQREELHRTTPRTHHFSHLANLEQP
jgi:hypothetical protein